jgi:2-polyprenyl-3-methyl-5-hydroxy-6-metoxy-1,4-benzoquinol methylase
MKKLADRQSYQRLCGTPCTPADKSTIEKRNRFISRNIDLDRDYMLLDVGCGLGIYKSENFNSLGIDIVRENLEKAKLLDDDLDVTVMDAEFMGIKKEVFDVVLCIEVIEHLQDDRAALKEICRVLRPDGKLIVTAPNRKFPFETHGITVWNRQIGSYGLGFPLLSYMPRSIRKHFATVHNYTTQEIISLLENSGFRVLELTYLWPNLDIVKRNIPYLKFFFDKIGLLFDYLESSETVLSKMGMTIIICCEVYNSENR